MYNEIGRTGGGAGWFAASMTRHMQPIKATRTGIGRELDVESERREFATSCRSAPGPKH
jgi:hypothetical protein